MGLGVMILMWLSGRASATSNRFKDLRKTSNRHTSYLPMSLTQTQEFGFTSEFPREKTKLTFLDEVKEFFKETDGGAVPVGSAAAALGIQTRRLYDLIDYDLVQSVEFLTPNCKKPCVLVPLKEIERLHRDGLPKPKMGRPRKSV